MNRDTVLFVDDEIGVLRAWQRCFKSEPYDMVFSHNSDQALEICQTGSISVLVTDYRMPVIDGIELLHKVSECSPSTVKILVSGHATLSTAKEALNQCNLFRLFEKPCSPVEVAAGVRSALDAKRANASGSSEQKALDYGLAELERKYPGISKVHRDSKGYIIME